MENARATIGGNNPPSAIDDAIQPFADIITEAEGWLDGEPVTNEAQMKSVDALIKAMKAAKKAVETAEEIEARPHYDMWKATKAIFAPTITDLDRIGKGLVAIVDGFKRKLAAEKAETERLAREEAWRKTREAEALAAQARAGDIEAQRAAAQAQEAAEAAQRAATAAGKDTVKGLRMQHRPDIYDHRAALHWIAINDREALTAFIETYVGKHFMAKTIDGVNPIHERVAV